MNQNQRVEVAPKRQTQVVEQNDYVRNEIQGVEEALSELISRLSPVLRDSLPTTGADKPERDTLVPLAEDLRSTHGRLCLIREALVDMLSRLEL